ncbi:molecular chaperone DnaJ (plasmid) [Pseudoalteromonas xiamenensis]|uniref:molecular chaperone DnaJ n=1 Tax=Pseudoalteromonas xiamenensis TaxID=882626 RepID=UPI0027E40C3A|nr:molecular chaperone DnaJ [Pseudoalteromonas xiamenensis]WMN61765.1 molecular chaperone DnaJ [Pseudoalteromonas xiamenensis]
MSDIKSNLHPCKHCNETGTCTSGEKESSCIACAKYHELKRSQTYIGLACGTCGGLGQSEPLTERINKRTKPLLAMTIVFVLLICVTVLAFSNNPNFSAFLAFAGTLIGSITTFYFSKGDKNT